MNKLGGWVFTYIEATKTWRAAKRDYYVELFNGGDNFLASDSFNTLCEIIIKTDGDKEKLKKLIK